MSLFYEIPLSSIVKVVESHGWSHKVEHFGFTTTTNVASMILTNDYNKYHNKVELFFDAWNAEALLFRIRGRYQYDARMDVDVFNILWLDNLIGMLNNKDCKFDEVVKNIFEGSR